MRTIVQTSPFVIVPFWSITPGAEELAVTYFYFIYLFFWKPHVHARTSGEGRALSGQERQRLVRSVNCKRAEGPFRNEEEHGAEVEERMPERAGHSRRSDAQEGESVRDQVENGDSKSRKGVSHLHGFTGCHNPARVLVPPETPMCTIQCAAAIREVSEPRSYSWTTET